MQTTDFNRHPDQYLHWKLDVVGPVARLTLGVREELTFAPDPGYTLKLNSYDLGVDLELYDAVQRLRFEHPSVRVLVLTSALDKVFCAGANIFMLQGSSHPFKVNFCKFTNETRLYLEQYAREAGVRTLAALNGTASGGGYELAISCDEIHLLDDGSSAVSLPETPLLGVLPGTGGLTRLVDKRKVRRDRADVFCTLAEGLRGRRAVEWGLVDACHPRSRFDEGVMRAVEQILETPDDRGRDEPGFRLSPVRPEVDGAVLRYRHVTVETDPDRHVARLTVRAPEGPQPTTPEELLERGDAAWLIAMARELDDALLQLRFHGEAINLVVLRTEGDPGAVLAAESLLIEHDGDWRVREVRLLLGRVLRRLDLTGRSFFALIEPGSCFVGTLFELAVAADRSYMLDDPDRPTAIQLSALNRGPWPMSQGLTRLECRFLGDPAALAAARECSEPLDAAAAAEHGLVTFVPDDIDWDDEVRVAIEERASLSPDALTGMEASLRFAGPETVETKIFGRLSAWQNWIFTRPNAVGEQGALTMYGRPERPLFRWERT